MLGFEQALALTLQALAFTLDLDPARLRADTPLAGLGADSVAVIAAADVIESCLAETGRGLIDDELVRTARTVGELALSVQWGKD